MLIELYFVGDHAHYFFHSLIGRSANDALSRIVALRVKNRIGGDALTTIDDYGFLLTLRRFQELPLDDLRQRFARATAENDLADAQIRIGAVVVSRRRADRVDGAAKFSRPSEKTEAIEQERGSFVSCPRATRARTFAPGRSVPAAGTHLPRGGQCLSIPGRCADFRLEAPGIARHVAVLVCDLCQRHQGEHDAGGSGERNRTNYREMYAKVESAAAGTNRDE